MIIKISKEDFKNIKELAMGNLYKSWLHANGLKGTFSNACKYILSTKGTWNAHYNSWIEEHYELLIDICRNPEAEMRIIRKTIEIYTVGYKQEEHVEMY
ncbi:MAG: hypothetical protein ABF991_00535 [Liquorilactobacillus hordei]|uniref:hypothetical protein n=1 Tax=Liquorilactobacillus hordei TaxID=468911 RepID=UPI0039E8A7B0